MEEFLNIEERDRVANQQNGDAAAGDAGNDEPHELRRIQRRIHNAPLGPAVVQVVQGYDGQERPLRRPRKMRSIFTMARKTTLLADLYPPETATLLINAKRVAMQSVGEEQRSEYFANYLAEHMTSQNYPNGVGLPDRWGQF
ncbi:male-specific protein scotti [Drosophila serrata]|uniref:male-specific protein scotti n=1 Tax=Drosophila serrata TaxID=7274 RepID=UPI000A1D2217|nr:male-specific protein scotti [Drosophila serrata]KAH8361127.1 hypothetical protein KR200_010308 [Drosophila serrata]